MPRESARAANLCLDSGRLCHVDSSFGQIRYRRPADAQPTRLLIPQPGATGTSLASGAGHPASVVVDLPGHGGSALPESLSFDHCVETVRRVAATLGATIQSVSGAGASDALARAVAATDSELAHAAAGPADFQGAPPDLTPEHSGAHLFRAWHWLREQFLARDEAPPEPVRLTKMLIDLVDARAAHRAVQETLDAQSMPNHRADGS